MPSLNQIKLPKSLWALGLSFVFLTAQAALAESGWNPAADKPQKKSDSKSRTNQKSKSSSSSSSSQKKSVDPESDISLTSGIGTIAYNLGRTTVSRSGEETFLDKGSIYWDLNLGIRYPLLPFLELVPTIIYSFNRQLTYDSAARRQIFIISVPASYKLESLFPYGEYFDVKAGLGVLFYSQLGLGGSTTLDNGTTTSRFYLPGSSSSSRNLSLSTGFGARFHDFRLDLDLLSSGLISSRRSFSAMAQLSFYVF